MNFYKLKSFSIIVLLMLIFSVLPVQAQSSNHSFRAGIVLQKTQNLYFENGLTVDYSNSTILQNKLHFNISYLSSRLGSAISTNALKQDNFLLGANYHFFPKKPLQLFLGVNTGLFVVDYEYDVFNDLPNSALLLSSEIGINYNCTKIPLVFNLSVGYNFRNGNGVDIPGSLFPVYYKLALMYNFENMFGKTK